MNMSLCRDVGHFCGDVGLFCGDVELILGDNGLFCFAGEIMCFFLWGTFAEEVNEDKRRPLLAKMYINVYAFMHLSTSSALQDSWAVG